MFFANKTKKEYKNLGFPKIDLYYSFLGLSKFFSNILVKLSNLLLILVKLIF